MQNLEKTLDSGAQLTVTMVPFEVGHRLLKVVTREAETIKLSLGSIEIDSKKLRQILSSDGALETIKNIVMRLMSSEAIDIVLWECMSYATYNKQKILKSNNVFDSAEARSDYLIVAKEVLWFNLSPFFRNLGSELNEVLKKSISSQSTQITPTP